MPGSACRQSGCFCAMAGEGPAFPLDGGGGSGYTGHRFDGVRHALTIYARRQTPMYDFDQCCDQRGHSSIKWDRCAPGELPMWIAVMDFPVSPSTTMRPSISPGSTAASWGRRIPLPFSAGRLGLCATAARSLGTASVCA